MQQSLHDNTLPLGIFLQMPFQAITRNLVIQKMKSAKINWIIFVATYWREKGRRKKELHLNENSSHHYTANYVWKILIQKTQICKFVVRNLFTQVRLHILPTLFSVTIVINIQVIQSTRSMNVNILIISVQVINYRVSQTQSLTK